MALQQLIRLVEFLETYRGHDKMIRLTTYVAMFMGGEGNTPAQKKWKTVSKEMGACRVILRLFDDLPMFLYNLSIGFGLKGSRSMLKPFELLTSILNQCFYPSEHIAWLRQKGIMKGMALPFLLIGLAIWTACLILEIIKSSIKLRYIAIQANKLIKQQQLDTDRGGQSSQNVQIKENLKKLSVEKKDEILSIAHNACDLINAVSWYPPGFLWAQSLPASANGVFGTIATLIMLYRNWPPAPTLKGKENTE